MLNSLLENKNIWYTDFSLQETFFYISWQNHNILCLQKNFQLKIWKSFLKSDSQVRYVIITISVLQMGNLMLEQFKILLKIHGTCQRSGRKEKTADPVWFRSTMAASDLSQTSHLVSLLLLCICEHQSAHGYCLRKLSCKNLGKEVKI